MICEKYFGRDGTPFEGVREWAQEFEKVDRHVKRDVLPNGKVVSTVWLGLCHNYALQHTEHLIFETMVFGGKNGDELDCLRYTTEEQALAGHQRMCDKWALIEGDSDETENSTA